MSVITVRQGDAYTGVRHLIHTVVDADGNPYDLTGVSELRFGVFRRRSSTTPLVEKTLGEGVSLAPQTGATVGVAYIELEPEDTEDLDPADFMTFEVEGEDSEGPFTLDAGRFVLLAQQLVEAV